jgi:hypothetical protein
MLRDFYEPLMPNGVRGRLSLLAVVVPPTRFFMVERLSMGWEFESAMRTRPSKEYPH